MGPAYFLFFAFLTFVVLTNAKPPILLELHVNLTKNGFHRELLTNISISDPVALNCNLLVIQYIPSGAYLSINEIDDRIRHLNKTQQNLFSYQNYGPEFDVEKPAFQSKGQQVSFVFKYIPPFTLLSIPIHFRYQSPTNSENFTIRVEIPQPNEITLLCENMQSHHTTWNGNHTVYSDIPIGNLQVFSHVTKVTLSICFISSLFLIFVIISK
jgi:hypothetical protein